MAAALVGDGRRAAPGGPCPRAESAKTGVSDGAAGQPRRRVPARTPRHATRSRPTRPAANPACRRSAGRSGAGPARLPPAPRCAGRRTTSARVRPAARGRGGRPPTSAPLPRRPSLPGCAGCRGTPDRGSEADRSPPALRREAGVRRRAGLARSGRTACPSWLPSAALECTGPAVERTGRRADLDHAAGAQPVFGGNVAGQHAHGPQRQRIEARRRTGDRAARRRAPRPPRTAGRRPSPR